MEYLCCICPVDMLAMSGYRSEFSESLKSHLISAAVRRRGPARSQILALKPCEAVDPLP